MNHIEKMEILDLSMCVCVQLVCVFLCFYVFKTSDGMNRKQKKNMFQLEKKVFAHNVCE